MTQNALATDQIYETSDAARELDLTPAGVHTLEARRVLIPVARTARGTRLYLQSDVRRVAAERRAAKVRG